MKTILLVNRSQGRALKTSQSLLDRYAKRVEQNTWSTQITEDGMEVLRKLLAKSSSKNTSITCFHRERSALKLLWSIGNTTELMPDGSIPVHEHQLPPPPLSSSARLGCLLVKTAGLGHDFGKASSDFQKKLDSDKAIADPVRHEWLSYHLFQAMLKNPEGTWDSWWTAMQPGLNTMKVGDTIFNHGFQIKSANEAISWLISTHHRFPERTGCDTIPSLSTATFFAKQSLPGKTITYNQNPEKLIQKPIFDFLKNHQRLLKNATTKEIPSQIEPHFWMALSMLTRPALILADHEVSSVIRPPADDLELIANTRKDSNKNLNLSKKIKNQTLNWHLLNVGKTAETIFNEMSRFNPKGLSSSKRNTLTSLSNDESSAFYWQDRTLQFLKNLPQKPTLMLNLAGTGAGKTRMNVRALAQLCPEEKELRISTGLNLRSLTLQTIESYRNELDFGDEIAGVIGDQTAQKLFNSQMKDDFDPLDYEIDEDGNPFETQYEITSYSKIQAPKWLQHSLQNKKMRRMEDVIMAPVVACTIDYLVAGGDLTKQANNAIATIRLLSSDLVLDEIDSYDPKALVSILRMVVFSALGGRNVIASSATLSEPCAQALIKAWSFGSSLRHALNVVDKKETEGTQVVMFDNEITPRSLDYKYDGLNAYGFRAGESIEFKNEYSLHLNQMIEKTKEKNTGSKMATIIEIPEMKNEKWLQAIDDAAISMHEKHRQSLPGNGKQVSVGLIRVANIKQAILVAKKLSTSKENSDVKVSCYHSQLPTVQRNYLEKKLDVLLKRKLKNGRDPFLTQPEIVSISEKAKTNDIRFIVVATPVEEIGRDHDFDWAIIEPSSSQSIVQTAGRVQRHRGNTPTTSNIGVLEYCYKYINSIENPQKKIENFFSMPGLDVHKSRNDTYLFKQKKYLHGRGIYKEASMTQFIGKEALEPNFLNASLKFEKVNNEPLHLFSKLDNESIEKTLSMVDGMFSMDAFGKNNTELWSYKDAYKTYCLRERTKDGMFEVDIILPTPSDEDRITNVVMSYYCINEKKTKSDPKQIDYHPRNKNDWLVPSSEEMNTMIENAGIAIDNAMRIGIRIQKLHDQHSNPSIIWDASWGLHRQPTTKKGR